MNSTQIQSTLAPLISFLAGLAAGKGLFGLDSATWATLLGAIAAFGATIWGALATRTSAVVAQANAVTSTTVTTTDPELAKAAGVELKR